MTSTADRSRQRACRWAATACACLALVVGTLVGCGREEPDHRAPGVDAPPDAADTPALPNGALLSYRREGGILPASEEWTFFTEGRLVGAAGQSASTEPEAIERFVSVCEDVGEAAGRADPGDCRDCVTYHITYRGKGGVRSLTLVEGSPEVPATVWEALKPLQAAARKAARP